MMVLDLGWLCEIHVCASDEEAPTCRVYKDHSLTGPENQVRNYFSGQVLNYVCSEALKKTTFVPNDICFAIFFFRVLFTPFLVQLCGFTQRPELRCRRHRGIRVRGVGVGQQ